MAKCKLSPREFIKNAFAPQIAVYCSAMVDDICLKNNLSFIELLGPFCTLTSDVQLLENNGVSITIQNLKVAFVDIHFRPPQTALARKYLNACVRRSYDSKITSLQIGDTTLNVPSNTPWFEAWRELFLQMHNSSDHEFTNHFLACLLVVASHETNCVDSMNSLNQSLNQLQNVSGKVPKWFSLPILRYYVLLHDNLSGSSEKANQYLETFKVSYGSNNCFLLRINSSSVPRVDCNLSNLWRLYISSIFNSTNVNQGTPDSSPSTVTMFDQSTTEGESANDKSVLSYHPLSPTLDISKAINFLDSKTDLPQNTAHYGMHLTSDDIDQIRALIKEFCSNSLIPYVEKQIQNLNETLVNKKGMSKSLLSATKRWFAPSKIGSNNGATNLPVYAYDALELQMRKLGDLYFMFCNYGAAFSVYHAVKRDFNADQAWSYYAGALEMASLSSFMTNEIVKKTFDYMEESIVTYLNVCKLPHFATRATLLSLECLKESGLYGEAAHQLIRMTSEDSDLLSALLLEQAAYCFLNSNRPQMTRKYAFHMVLTGHRFSKAAQKEHALRCYKQALEIYRDKGWTFAVDHIYYTIGKLSSGLNLLQEASDSFSMLLTTESKQSVDQQVMFLQDYLNNQEMLLKNIDSQDIPLLSLPLLNSTMIKVLVGPTLPLSVPGKIAASGVAFDNFYDEEEISKKWTKLEEAVVQEAQGTLPIIFKPLTTLYTKHNFDVIDPTAIMTEIIQVSVTLTNPLSIDLHLKDVYLFWNLTQTDGSEVSNKDSFSHKLDKFIKTHIVKSCVLSASNTQEIVLTLTPLCVGKLHLMGLFYGIVYGENRDNLIKGKLFFDLNKIDHYKKNRANEEDSTAGLPITIVPPVSCLQIYFSKIDSEVLSDQIQCTTMEMRNVGVEPLKNIHMITSTPNLVSTCEFSSKLKANWRNKRHITYVTLPNGALDPGHSHSINIWVKAPHKTGFVCVDLLIYYENSISADCSRYRVVRHNWNLHVDNSLDLICTATESFKSKKVKELIFSLKIINIGKLKVEHGLQTEISLLRATLLSSRWELKCPESDKMAYVPKLYPQQAAFLLLKVRQHLATDNFSHVLLGKKSKETNKAFFDFAQRLLPEINDNNYIDDGAITENKVKEKEGVVFVEWCACVKNNGGVLHKLYGQSHVTIEKLYSNKMKREGRESAIFVDTPLPILPITNVTKDDNSYEKFKYQISISLIHSSYAVHNFRAGKVCVIPIKISLHNDSFVKSNVSVVAVSSNNYFGNSGSRPNFIHPSPSKDYKWVGFSNIHKTIEKLGSLIVVLKVAVTSPGVYDLAGRLELWCYNELNDKPVLQNLRASCCLTVRDTSR